MVSLSSIGHGLKQGGKNIKRNGKFSIASVCTMSACLFLVGIFYFILANLEYNIGLIESNVGISVYFDEGISEERIASIGNEIKTNISDIDSMNYHSAEEVWESYKQTLDPEMVKTFGEDNPLKDSAYYSITLKNLEKQKEVSTRIEKIDGVRKVQRSDKVADAFGNFNKFIGIISAGIIAILLLISIFLINITVSMGITVRREEISIMKLIGATDFFIRGPFIMEGLLLGFFGACIPLTVLFILYDRIMSFVDGKFAALSLQFLSLGSIYMKLVPICLGIGVGIGLLGSYLTVRKHLRR